MSAKILDGKALAETIRAEIKEDVAKFIAETGVQPTLAVVLKSWLSYQKSQSSAFLPGFTPSVYSNGGFPNVAKKPSGKLLLHVF